jgi:hypothetical protein
VIRDEEICQFAHLIDLMGKLAHVLRLKKKSRENFIKYGKVEEIANTSFTSVSVN